MLDLHFRATRTIEGEMENIDAEHLLEHQRTAAASKGNRERLLELVHEVNNLAKRIHSLEDHFEPDGTIDQLSEGLARCAFALEQLRNGAQRSRHSDT